MFTSRHNRSHNGLLTAALTAGALALGLTSGNALAMGSPSTHDFDLAATPIGQTGVAVSPDAYIGGRVGRLPRTGELPAGQAGNARTTSASSEDYIGGRVGRLPRPTAVQ